MGKDEGTAERVYGEVKRGREFWEQRLGEEWTLKLKDTLKSPYMNKLLNFLNDEYKDKIIYPSKSDIFKAFDRTSFNDVKVVLIAQDPYYNGLATGLCFGNPVNQLYFSPSLQVIYRCIELEFYDGLNLDFDWTLEDWASQGVLMLNTALTVRKGSPNSHKKPWMQFTRGVIKALNDYNSGVIFILWGAHAQKLEKLIAPHQHVLKWSHPASICYTAKKDWKCPNFKQANELLVKMNNTEITW